MAKLDRMNARFQRGAVEIILDLLKGLSHKLVLICNEKYMYVEIILDLLKGLSPTTTFFIYKYFYICGNYIRPA